MERLDVSGYGRCDRRCSARQNELRFQSVFFEESLVSGDESQDRDGHEVGLQSLPGWGGGFGINYTFINPGIYEVKAVVDGNNAVAELSEDNNTIIAKLNIITPSSSLPDLQVTGLSMMHIYANQPNTIIASIKNVGLGTAGSFTAKLYVDGGYVGEETRPGTTSPGSSVGMATKYTFTTVGPHELKVIVDSNSAVVEESEENNVMVRTTYLQ